ncbi:DUF418 domain-containing protein [Streptomyces sp. NPDC058579]|uniref:DUF418 domain-containing protein n=1 Tax=Streptomyces sp. NPDC058579 TaxID=3346548 RepID=UPI003662E7E3
MRSQAPAAAPSTSTVRRPRIDALDALRGFALCGILLVNVPQITNMVGYIVPGNSYPISEALDLTVHQRFFPIFSFLFGLSFALFYEGAATRSERPRVLLLRRLVALGLLGALHGLLQPGEALRYYAIAALVVLVPATWLPRWAVALAGGALTVAGFTLAGGGLGLIPGLFLLGMATARYGIADSLERRGGQLCVVLALAAPLAVAATLWQHRIPPTDPLATRVGAAAGLVSALAYIAGFLLLLRTPAGGALARFFAPLGRMALTNYVTATLLVLAAAPVLGLHDSGRWGTALALSAAIIAVQAAASRWWLTGHRYGPLEWGWRSVTWWQAVPLAKPRTAQTG